MEIKLEGKIAYLENEEDHRHNTSFDSMGTDQIFMTYAENEQKYINEETDHDIKKNHILIDEEINKIKENLRMPTTETEEDELLPEQPPKSKINAFEYNVKVDKELEEREEEILSPFTRKIA